MGIISMWYEHKMYSQRHNRDMWYAANDSYPEYHGPYDMEGEATTKCNELNETA